MEYVEGPNLKEFIGREDRVAPLEAVDITCQVLRALGEAHKHGIVHRDLKPENIMVIRATDGALTVKVLDFGLSKLVDMPMAASMRTQPGQIMGTPMYMAPEQGAGEEVDHRTDLYAVGLILFELLTGETPFQGQTLTQLFVRQATEPAPSASETHPNLAIPPDLDSAIRRALEKEKDDRFQSAAEMLKALETADLSALPTVRLRRSVLHPWRSSKQSPRPTRGRKPSRKLPLALAGVLVVVLAVVSMSWLGGLTDAAEVSRVSLKTPAQRSTEEQRYVQLLEDARRMLRTGDVPLADARVVEAHGLDCRDAEAYLVRALVNRARGDDDAALADLHTALQVDPTYAAAAAELGWVAIDRVDLEGAQARFSEALLLDNQAVEAIAGLGAVAYEIGDVGVARERLERAIGIDPEEPHASLYLGRMCLDAGDAQGAVDVLVRAKLNAPRSWRPYAALGEAYLALGRAGDAEKQLSEAVALEPDAADALTSLGSLLIDGERYADATLRLESALRVHPSWGRARVLLAIALEAEGRLSDAILALERALEAGEDGPEVRMLLGILYQREGSVAKGIEQYDEAIAADPTLALPHKNKGLALSTLDRYGEAAQEMEAALELDPDDAFAHKSLGVLYKDFLGGGQQALEHFRAYEELDGSDERVAGWIRELGG